MLDLVRTLRLCKKNKEICLAYIARESQCKTVFEHRVAKFLTCIEVIRLHCVTLPF